MGGTTQEADVLFSLIPPGEKGVVPTGSVYAGRGHGSDLGCVGERSYVTRLEWSPGTLETTSLDVFVPNPFLLTYESVLLVDRH